MAKSKTSQQEDLSSKTGINVISDLGFSKTKPVIERTEEIEKPIEPEIPEEKVDKLAEEPMLKEESANLTQVAPSIEEEKPQIAETQEKPDLLTQKPTRKRSKLRRPDDPQYESATCKISAIISEEARANLEKYSHLYGYKKMSPFLNDLLERLDLYMD